MKKRSLMIKISKEIDRVCNGGNIGFFLCYVEDLLIVYLKENYRKGEIKKIL